MLRNSHSISQILKSLVYDRKVFWVIHPYRPHRTPPVAISYIYFRSVEPHSPTGENLHRLHSLRASLGRFWNPTKKRPERQLHSSAAMLRFDHFRLSPLVSFRGLPLPTILTSCTSIGASVVANGSRKTLIKPILA